MASRQVLAWDMSESYASYWSLEPELLFLNHGSFGACPTAVLEAQHALRLEMERSPLTFLDRSYSVRLQQAKAALAAFVGAASANLVFLPSTTAAVNTVLRNLALGPGDEIVATNFGYNACRNALLAVTQQAGARLVTVDLPFPVESSSQWVEAVVSAVSPRCRLLLVDHVTSVPGAIVPIEAMVRALPGVDVLVDGAHAPGMLDLDLEALGVAYYAGNCHKWLCAPKGSAFLYVRPDRQPLHPLIVSHGANSRRTDLAPFQLEFEWMGTADPTPYLAVPAAIDHVGSLLAGGWPAVRQRNRALALAGRQILAEVLDLELPAPEDMIGSMATVILPGERTPPDGGGPFQDPLREILFQRHRIEVPVARVPGRSGRWLRISAQLYNTLEDYRRLASALRAEL